MRMVLHNWEREKEAEQRHWAWATGIERLAIKANGPRVPRGLYESSTSIFKFNGRTMRGVICSKST
jgi:hypothetical protein